jgi:hypothetical protein
MIVAWEDSRGGEGYVIYAQHVADDFPTPTLVSLASVEAEPGCVVLTWYSPEPLTGRVERRIEGSEWMAVGSPRRAGTNLWTFEDRSVAEGRYAYRLSYAGSRGEELTAETWVSVPGAYVLALEGFRPNPARGEPRVSLSIARSQGARLEVFDAAGREVARREFGSLSPGKHVVALGREARWASGVYWLRLTQGNETRVAKGMIVR